MKDSIVIFDIDGTLSDPEHRRHLLDTRRHKRPQWMDFFMQSAYDPPIQKIVTLYQKLHRAMAADGTEFWLVSGRSDIVRAVTEDWLESNSVHHYHQLLMRKDGDFRPDDEVKWEMVAPVADRVLWVFDDRNKVVEMWRRRGLTCLQVANGSF